MQELEQFNIKAVVKYSGINAHTLRAWERRYGVIQPVRGTSGRRMYSIQEAERLRALGQLVSHGHTISNLARMSDEDLRSLIWRSSTDSADEQRSVAGKTRKLLTTPEAISESCGRVLDVLSTFELEKLHAELLRAKAQHSARSFVLDVALPLVVMVGERVLAGKLSIAQEHAFSSILKLQLGEIIFSLRNGSGLSHDSKSGDYSVVLATQDGDLHEFGILMSAVLCSAYGVRCHYLGPNLPAKPLAEAAGILRSSAVLVGRTAVLNRKMKGSEQAEYLRELDGLMPAGIELWIGGALECDLSQVGADDGARTIRYIRSLQDLDGHLQKLND